MMKIMRDVDRMKVNPGKIEVPDLLDLDDESENIFLVKGKMV